MTEGRENYRIATFPGDGVGPEVAAAARSVLDAAGHAFGFALEWSELLAGGAAIERRTISQTRRLFGPSPKSALPGLGLSASSRSDSARLLAASSLRPSR